MRDVTKTAAVAVLLLASTAIWAEDRLETIKIEGNDQNVYILDNLQPMLDLFNEQAKQQNPPETFSACQPAVDVPVYHADNYGGYCRASNGTRMMVCADTMVGNFRAVPQEGAPPTIPQLVAFVLANCTGG